MARNLPRSREELRKILEMMQRLSKMRKDEETSRDLFRRWRRELDWEDKGPSREPRRMLPGSTMWEEHGGMDF